MFLWSTHRTVAPLRVHADPDDLNVDCCAPVVHTTQCLSVQMIIQALGISN